MQGLVIAGKRSYNTDRDSRLFTIESRQPLVLSIRSPQFSSAWYLSLHESSYALYPVLAVSPIVALLEGANLLADKLGGLKGCDQNTHRSSFVLAFRAGLGVSRSWRIRTVKSDSGSRE